MMKGRREGRTEKTPGSALRVTAVVGVVSRIPNTVGELSAEQLDCQNNIRRCGAQPHKYLSADLKEATIDMEFWPGLGQGQS